MPQPRPTLAPLSVKPIEGEFFRFYIGSRSRADKWHLVDLQENNWNGKCDCERFSFHCQPEINRGIQACNSLRCAHIRRAIDYFFLSVAPKIAAKLENH